MIILTEIFTKIEELYINQDFGQKNFGVQNERFLCYYLLHKKVGYNIWPRFSLY